MDDRTGERDTWTEADIQMERILDSYIEKVSIALGVDAMEIGRICTRTKLDGPSVRWALETMCERQTIRRVKFGSVAYYQIIKK